MKQRKLNSHCNKVLDYIKAHGSITQAEAYEMGIYRLSGRIFDLRHRGYDIISVMTDGVNRDGERVKFASYRLAEKEQP